MFLVQGSRESSDDFKNLTEGLYPHRSNLKSMVIFQRSLKEEVCQKEYLIRPQTTLLLCPSSQPGFKSKWDCFNQTETEINIFFVQCLFRNSYIWYHFQNNRKLYCKFQVSLGLRSPVSVSFQCCVRNSMLTLSVAIASSQYCSHSNNDHADLLQVWFRIKQSLSPPSSLPTPTHCNRLSHRRVK